MSYTSKFLAAVIGLLVMAVVASRQLFLFTAGDTLGLDSQGGRYHLWLAVGSGIAASIAGALMFHIFLRRQSVAISNITRTPIRTLLPVGRGKPSNNSFSSTHWPRQNSWLSEGQPDDRTPMDGSVAESGGPASAQLALARQSHQIMFKKWSQARHD